MSLPRYPAYKPSGVEWLEQLPATWAMKRLKYVANRTEVKIEADEEHPLPYIGLEHVESWTGRLLPLDEELVPTGISNCFKSGDTLFGKLRPYLAKACNVDFEGLCSSELLVLRGKNYEPRFLLYQLLSQDFINLVDSSTYGSKMPRASWDFIGSCELPLPPLEEQQTIADFLDTQTAKIDTLLAKKRQFIDKLKEKRSALIARTVTRGLPPAAAQAAGLEPHPAMKESGVEWIGMTPAHWKVKPLKFVFPRLYSGVSVNSESTPTEGDFPGVLKTSCVYGNQFYPDENKRVLEGETDRVSCPVARDSLIISRMNTPDLVGNCGYVEYDYPNLFLPDRLWIARFQNHLLMHGKFAWYLVSSHGVNQLTGILATGTSGSMKNLSQDAFLNIAIAIPSSKEQQAIAAYLDRETARIDQLTAKVEAAIARLTEYRQALITAAVTGKIDVRARTVG